MSIELYPSIAKIKRNGVYENLPGFVPETGSVATQQMIATSESNATAQYVHNKGEYFRLNDTLYQAIVKINVGDAIVVGTNCEVAVIGNDLTHVANSIAAYELGIATSSHNTGDYFMVNETMYVATADIQVGDNISTSTNCRKAVVGDELSELKNAIFPLQSIIDVAVASFSVGAKNIPILNFIVGMDYNSSGWSTIKATVSGKNLFNKNNYSSISNGYINNDKIATASQRELVYIKCKPNTTYSISRKAVLTSDRFSAGYTKTIPASGVSVYGEAHINYVQTIGNNLELHVSTGEDAEYLVVWAYWGNAVEALNTLQIEEASTASPYVSFVGSTTTISFANIPESIYGGYINITTGEVTSTLANDGTELAEPKTFQVSANVVNTIYGSNNVFASSGDVINLLYYTDITYYATPEMFGAIGDGVTDDTAAWQSAINSGYPVVATSHTYLCGKISVNHDTTIDCNNATFICSDSILFDCYGTAGAGTAESDYTAFGDYSLSDTFSGIVYIKGTNNVFKTKDYYVGGSIEYFHNGVLNTQIPVDITNVTAYRLNPSQINIRNIKNVSFANETGAIIIKQTYCAFSVIENVNTTNLCFSVVQFNQCFKCTYTNSHFDIPQYGAVGTNCYPIEVINSCYTLVTNIVGHNVGWHCATTGGTTLCRKTRFLNCEFYCDYDSSAYADHSNGIETEFNNCVLSSLLLGYLGTITNCDIVCFKEQSACVVSVCPCNIEKLGTFKITNCNFYPQSSSYSGIKVRESVIPSGNTSNWELKSLSITGCKIISNVALTVYKDSSASITGTISYETINIIDSDFTNTIAANHVYVFPS